jgi:cyclopropane-fatty-acyl-phospholipid synthase
VDAGTARRALALLERLFAGYEGSGFAVRLWDGSTWLSDPAAERQFTIVLRHEGALRAMFWPPGELSLSEAFIYGDFDVEGDLEAVFPLADRLLAERPLGRVERLGVARQLLALPAARRERRRLDGAAQERRWRLRRRRSGRQRRGRPLARLHGRRHSLERDRAAVGFHYNRSNGFFGLFLDPRMVYSCAYFDRADADLTTAQERKLDLVCRKLRLRPGERLLDVGCGWGALVQFAAERYGVEALGITLSEAQVELARERIDRAGLGGRCRIELLDYRELDEREAFDKVVSVGMFEHVGEELLAEYFGRVASSLRAGGVFLNHGIARAVWSPPRRGASFLDRYVFPDGGLAPISTTLTAAEQTGFEVRDVESLREHYTLTLRHWVRRLEARRAEAVAAVGEPTYRVWRLYMAGSAYGFVTGRVGIYQTLLVKPDGGKSGLPLTREDWYR